MAELLSRISGISLRAEEEAGSGILSVKDLVANIPPFAVRTSRNTRVFSVGLHSPPSPKSEMHISPASSDLAGARGRNAAVAASMAMLVEQVQIVARVLFFQHFTDVCARSLFESSICLDEKFLVVLLRQMQCGFLIFCAPAGIYHTLVELANFRLSQLFCSARSVLYNFCGLPPPHNDSPLLLQCLVDSSVVVQLTLEDSTVLRLAADEDVPLVLNEQHDEWIEVPLPSDIVQASSAHCCNLFLLLC